MARQVILSVNNDWVCLSSDVLSQIYRQCHHLKIHVPGPLEWIASRRSVASLFSCLRVSMEASTADPRDKVYAILSLLQPSVRSLIPVDYSLSAEQVLSNAIMACITVSQSLAIFAYACLPVSIAKDLPNFSMNNLRDFLTQALPRGMPPQFNSSHNGPWVSHVENEGVGVDGAQATHLQYSSSVERLFLTESVPYILPRLRVRAHLIDLSLGPTGIVARQLEAAFSSSTQTYDPDKARIMTLFRQDKVSHPRKAQQAKRARLNDLFSKDNHGFNTFLSDIRKTTDQENTLSLAVRSGSRGTTQQPLHNESTAHLNHIFYTNYSIGFTSVHHHAGDAVYAVDGVRYPLLLRELRPGVFRVIGICYLWAALELDYWNRGTHKGLWPERPVDLGAEQTRYIEIY